MGDFLTHTVVVVSWLHWSYSGWLSIWLCTLVTLLSTTEPWSCSDELD